MENLTAKEKRITKAMARITSLFVAIITGLYLAISFDTPKQFLNSIGLEPYIIAIGATVISIILIFFADNQIFGRFIFFFPDFKENRKILGTWQIEIKFEEDGENKIRHGQLKVTDSLAGIKIKGNKLFDSSRTNVTMERWEADDVEFIDTPSSQVIIYLYKTGNTSSDESMSGNKVGLVVAQKSNAEDVYTGFFEDIPIEGSAQRREGHVSLYKPD